MPNWKDVLAEINAEAGGNPNKIGPAIDSIRRKYLNSLFEYTKRNVIAYYSGWLQHPKASSANVNDKDMAGLMLAVHQLEKDKGLDLILHTPGGDVAATESMVLYLKSIFGENIRAIVPQLAMSAGTMIALSTNAIIMGKHSSLGPIDPQIGGVPAEGVLKEFERARQEILSDPNAAGYWQFILQKYHPTFLSSCQQAIDMSRELVREWLAENMCQRDMTLVDPIIKHFSNHEETKMHARHIMIDFCQSLNMNIIPLEEDDDLQDLVLTTHHTFMHTFSRSAAVKIIENHRGIAFIESEGHMQMGPIQIAPGQFLPPVFPPQ